MKNIFIILIFINTGLVAQNLRLNKVAIFEDNKKKEIRYIDSLNRTKSIIMFSENNKPIDSLVLYYNNKSNSIKRVVDFNYYNDRFKINKDTFLGAKIFDIYKNNNSCEGYSLITNNFLLEEFVYNVCNIVNSSLYDGRSMKEIVKTKQGGNKIISEFDNLDSRFNLIEFINSYFYNEVLNKYTYEVSNGYLLKEEYIFHSGIFTINYSYNNNILQKIDALYNPKDKDSIKIERKYIIK